MLTKNQLFEIVDHMPEQFTAEDLFERIILMQKLEQAQKEIENGEGIDWEDVKKEMTSW